ncbi:MULTISPECIES: hypothetical protein [unclassified Rhizobium]|uniref:hypothetical protein n=1 Tax=unclassified Rhizobium TaxID=2613769 RepID=UPI00146A98EE|nr:MULTISPECIES: hypothetical protein [unclassified Rhizobium]MBD9451124.1 hypothetical protein [Rhizobium sp. RHZ02]
MSRISSKIAHVIMALALSLMVIAAMAMAPSVNAGLLGGQCVHAYSGSHDEKPDPDTTHVGACCTDMHCCPLMPSVLPDDTSLQLDDILFAGHRAASPLLLIRPIDPPPKALPV